MLASAVKVCRIDPAGLRFKRFQDFHLISGADSRVKAGLPVGVAGRPGLVDSYQKTVPVTINAHLDQPLPVARRFALDPERLPRAGPVGHLTGRQRPRDSRRVHPREHQHIAGGFVLCYDGHKSAIIIQQGCGIKRHGTPLQRAGRGLSRTDRATGKPMGDKGLVTA